MHYEGAHGDDRTHFEGAHGDNHPQKAQHYDVPKAAAKDRHHCEGAVAAALEPRCEGAAAVAQEPRCCKGSVGGQHQEVILNNQREAAVSRRSSRTSSKTLTSSPSKKGRDFTKEEVTGALQHMAGWKSVNTDIEVSI
ncbi:uncharacterized protein LOC121367031 [Gigantopelta aegis]|uniref:uncharacterized protein LOC121367031 n=1 Tax=Gigantopelta aegis TaxID=1735272 RepID=UPI001B88823E|nr:uncharacterized protein LOC121367031 [Gigantopelta aegis]